MTSVSNILAICTQKRNYPINILYNTKAINTIKSNTDKVKYNYIDINFCNKFDIYPIAILDQSNISNLDYIYSKYYSQIIILDDVSQTMISKNTDYWKNLKSYYDRYATTYGAIILTFSMEDYLFSDRAHSMFIESSNFNSILNSIQI